MWHVWNVYAREVTYSECGMWNVGMWDVRNVGYGMWDVCRDVGC